MSKITYVDKVTLNENTSIADINKVKASDLNEIKTVVNQNDDNTTTNTTEINTLKTSIEEINTNIETLNSKFEYSTDEQLIGKWMGADLYRKVFAISSISKNNSQEIDVSSLSIGAIRDFSGIVTYQTHYQGTILRKATVYWDVLTETITVYVTEDDILGGFLIAYYTKSS